MTPRGQLEVLTPGFHAKSIANVIEEIDVKAADCYSSKDRDMIRNAILEQHHSLDRFEDLIQNVLGRLLAKKIISKREVTSLAKLNQEMRPKARADASRGGDKGLIRDLMAAADEGNLNRVQALIARGVAVDGSLDDGESGRALWKASFEGHSAVVRLLLQSGADPNLTRTSDDTSPLTVACFNVRAGAPLAFQNAASIPPATIPVSSLFQCDLFNSRFSARCPLDARSMPASDWNCILRGDFPALHCRRVTKLSPKASWNAARTLTTWTRTAAPRSSSPWPKSTARWCSSCSSTARKWISKTLTATRCVHVHGCR